MRPLLRKLWPKNISRTGHKGGKAQGVRECGLRVQGQEGARDVRVGGLQGCKGRRA